MPPWGQMDGTCSAAGFRSLPAPTCALSGTLRSCSGTLMPLIPICSLLGMCPGFLAGLLASSDVSALPSRFLFLSTGTLILVHSTGSSCSWTDVSQRQELDPARLDHISWDGGYSGSGKRPILLSVESWKWVAWGKENHLGGMGQIYTTNLWPLQSWLGQIFGIFIVPALFCLIV